MSAPEDETGAPVTDDAGEIERLIEAMLFASAAPLSIDDIARRLPVNADIRGALAMLCRHYRHRGVRLVRVGEAWAFRTAPDLAPFMRENVTERRRLSRAATETLAIIAYHQPITRAEIEEIRGVSLGRDMLDRLLELNWIRPGRRRMTPGRPMTLVTTPAFLDHFGLESISDLPDLDELRAAGILAASDDGTQENGHDAQGSMPETDDA